MATVANYFYERRRGLARAAGTVGGLIIAGKYVVQQLEEARHQVLEGRVARDNLKRRFRQNQQDAAYMVMGLMPTLAEQMLEGMDVEALTQELQQKSKASKVKQPLPPPQTTSPPSEAFVSAHGSLPSDAASSSSEQGNGSAVMPGALSESELSGSMSFVSYPTHSKDTDNSMSLESATDLSKSTQSWVDEFATQSQAGLPPSADSLAMPRAEIAVAASAPSEASASLASSVSSMPSSSSASSSRTKAELWNEVKILTFTRTLTALYSTTLLTLFTHLQLSILGRLKYVQSVFQLAHDERARDEFRLPSALGLVVQLGADELAQRLGLSRASLWPAGLEWERVFGTAGKGDGIADEAEKWEDERGAGGVSPETEMRYLTLSWWLLHVGWKDVGERVRRGVEEVFDGVSLKEKLTPMELHRLLSDVRRRVELEVTFEGKERPINFLSTLLPPTAETLHYVLTKAGLRVTPPPHLNLPPRELSAPSSTTLSSSSPSLTEFGDPALTRLLEETRARLLSADFTRVLSAALDAAGDVLVVGLARSVFPHPRNAEADATPEDALVVPTQDDREVKVRLAGMLPSLARWSRLALTGLPNELVDNLGELREVEAWSAIVFSSFEEQFK